MAALNKDETESLRTVMKLLDYIKKHGFNPQQVGINSEQKKLQDAIHLAGRRVHTIVQMKGYYPK